MKLLHRCSQYGIVAVQIHDKRNSFIFQVIVRPVFRKCCSSLSCTAAFYCNSASNMLLYSLKVCVPPGKGMKKPCIQWAALLEKYKKEGEAMVELDQFKSILATYTEPLVEVRDSL